MKYAARNTVVCLSDYLAESRPVLSGLRGSDHHAAILRLNLPGYYTFPSADGAPGLDCLSWCPDDPECSCSAADLQNAMAGRPWFAYIPRDAHEAFRVLFPIAAAATKGPAA